MRYNALPVVFQWVLLTFASFRIQRIVTTDTWPPSEAFRAWVKRRTGANSGWSEFVSCSYCLGTWITLAVFAVAAQLVSVPLPVLQAVAASAVVGYAGFKE